MNKLLAEKLFKYRDEINAWLAEEEERYGKVFYSSVDVRDAGFKASIVDTNLYPAGFNNLHTKDLVGAKQKMQFLFKDCLGMPQKVILLIEEHTRNRWYLENVVVLKDIIESTGASVRIAIPGALETLVENESIVNNVATLFSQSGKAFALTSLEAALNEQMPEIVVLNNDLMDGVPDILKNSSFRVVPSAFAGWHSRLKSDHFRNMDAIAQKLGSIAGLDPWFFTAYWDTAIEININEDKDRERLADVASGVLSKIQRKYNEYEIKEKPYFFLKANYGTYGMGTMAFEDANDIISMNRKTKNKLFKGKSSRVINSFLVQEGIPSVHSWDNFAAEVCLYQIGSRSVGSFFRVNNQKSNRQNLNSNGMSFVPFPLNDPKEFGLCDRQVSLYKTMSRLAVLSARLEIDSLEYTYKNENSLSC